MKIFNSQLALMIFNGTAPTVSDRSILSAERQALIASLIPRLALLFLILISSLFFYPLNAAASEQTGSLTNIPLAIPDSFHATTGKPYSFKVLENDQGESLRLSASARFSQNGARLEINNAQDRILYLPPAGFTGIDQFWYEVEDRQGVKDTSTVSVSVLPFNSDTVQARSGVGLDFSLIEMHYGLLQNEPHGWQENSGLTGFTLVEDAPAGSTSLKLEGQTELHETELLTTFSASGRYGVVKIRNINGATVNLTRPLPETIRKGNHVWNFYKDASHPNTTGYLAIADFAVQQLQQSGDLAAMQNRAHVFLGDSWLDNGILIDRIRQQINMSSSINRAVGGRDAGDVLNAFDDDLPSQATAPDYVWLLVGTNDYWREVSAVNHIDAVAEIISRINALGAKAIVFDSSVGPTVYDPEIDGTSTIHFDLSVAYANDLKTLYDESLNDDGGSDDGGSDDGGSDDGGSDDGGSDDGGSDDGGSSGGGSGGGGSLWLELILVLLLAGLKRYQFSTRR